MKKPLKIAVIDCETDPFKFGRVPKPFCVEFLAEGICESFWGDDCILQVCNFIEALPDSYTIFAHNGGKFDFHFFADYIDNPINIINARIVRAKIFHHTFQDSYAIIPIPLKAYNKDVFDYTLLEENRREKHKRAILNYLHSDCVYLLELATKFIERFGLRLTVGQTAIKELQKFHKFERMAPETDAFFRDYYFGGRVQCFKGGLLKGPWEIYDVNSMYPKAMRDFKHPVNSSFTQVDGLPEPGNVYFLHFRGRNFQALPSKTKTGLTFEIEEGEFRACSHEIEAALELGLIEIDEIISCHMAVETISFGEFVDTFYKQKVDCKLAGDKVGEIFAKLCLNSSYGKFGTNPASFEEFKIVRDCGDDLELLADGWNMAQDFDTYEIWSKPAIIRKQSFYDVSIAASITSAARSILLRGLSQAQEAIYCDTDSIICKSFAGEISDTVLGAWKLEKKADNCAIAGKKLYCLYNDNSDKPIKLSSKGGTLTMGELINVAKGGEVEYINQAPTFSLKSNPKFISRTFKKTLAID
jgi:DNA polymerase type B, organellar and viral